MDAKTIMLSILIVLWIIGAVALIIISTIDKKVYYLYRKTSEDLYDYMLDVESRHDNKCYSLQEQVNELELKVKELEDDKK